MVKVDIIGFDEFEKRVKAASKKVANEIAHEVTVAGDLFVRNAKRDAPADLGQLRGGISNQKIADMTTEVSSVAKHSPYIEWGTITRVSVPGELMEYAAQFKGRGIRKNGGIFPRPFFFKQIPIIREKFRQNIKNILDRI